MESSDDDYNSSPNKSRGGQGGYGQTAKSAGMAKMFGNNRHKFCITLRQFKFAFKHKPHWHKAL